MHSQNADFGPLLPSTGFLSGVDRVHFSLLTPQVFNEVSDSRRKPVVFSDAFTGTHQWSLELISKALGDRKYDVRVYGAHSHTKPKRQWKRYCEFSKLSASEYIRLLCDGTALRENIYMAQVPFGDTPLADSIRSRIIQLEQKCHMEPWPSIDLNLWLGPAGHTEPLHFDNAHGTLMQLNGSKRLVLFPPEQTQNLYPFPHGEGIPPWFSQVDTGQPDFCRFPRYREALGHAVEVLLAEGELIFIPSTWWHEVTALGNSYVCSVNRFWKTSP